MTGVALVTGAGSGIGRASALALLADGWRVALLGRNRETLEQTASQSGATEQALVVPCDVADPAAVDAAFAATVARFGRLDMLFNNAGTNVAPKTIDELSVDEWDTVISVNLNGAFLCARAAATGGADHQQRFDLGPCAAPRFGALHHLETCHHRSDPMPVAGRAAFQHSLRADRHAVLQMANLPLETNVQFITIMATKMPFIGRG
jgi:NAD(P)-dependent dehydrogenase (short-subunit alcohol dehydrogenase family)